MIRAVQIVCIAAAVLAALYVFQVKYRAEHVAGRVAHLQRQVDSEKETLSLLKAEWSLLNQPARVQELVERHKERLEMAPLTPTQLVAGFEDLPARPPGIEDILNGSFVGAMEGATGAQP